MARLHLPRRPDTIRAAYCTVLYELRATRSAYDEVLSADRTYVECAQSIRLRLHMIRCESVCARCQCVRECEVAGSRKSVTVCPSEPMTCQHIPTATPVAMSAPLAELEDGPRFDPAAVDEKVLDEFGSKLEDLVAATDRLAAATNAKAAVAAAKNGGEKRGVTLEALHAHMRREEATSRGAALGKEQDLTSLPVADATLTVFFEADELMLSGDVESAVLGKQAAEKGYADRAARLAALSELKIPMDDVMAKLADAGVGLRPEFVDFVEQSAVRRMRLCCLSRGLKPILRQLLRDEGLGHVEVLAHDMYVDREKGHAWCVSFRDESSTGHDKAESVRRALHGTAKGGVVLVGRLACDFAPVKAGHVHCLFAPADSPLAQIAHDAGVKHRPFEGFAHLQQVLFEAPRQAWS